MESKYLTTRMVAEAIGTSASHVRRLIYAGLLRAIRIKKGLGEFLELNWNDLSQIGRAHV